MEKSYREGVATTLTPSHARAGRKDALEALDRGICGQAIELRNMRNQGADGVGLTGRQQGGVRQREYNVTLRSPRTHARIDTPCARTERPRCRPWRESGGPVGESESI